MSSIKERFTSHLNTNKWFYFLFVLLLGLNSYTFLSKKSAEKQHQEDLITTKIHFEDKAKLAISQSAKKQLTLMVKTFVWAVRSSMIRNNLDEVDQYFSELVQEDNIKEIVLADKTGKILVSTNKKHQSKIFKDYYPDSILKLDEVSFSFENDEYHVSAPVMSLNTRLGTLFIAYASDKVKWEMPTPGEKANESAIESPAQDSILPPKTVDVQ